MDARSKVVFVWRVSEFDKRIKKIFMNYLFAISDETQKYKMGQFSQWSNHVSKIRLQSSELR